jgi:tRNA A58 N-methylase Trm61
MKWLMDLDYIETHPFAMNRMTLLGAVVGSLGMLLAIYLTFSYQIRSSTYAALQAKQKYAQQQNLPKKKVERIDLKTKEISAAELAQVNAVIDELSQPWDAVLNELEHAEMRDIALLSLEPNVKKQQIVLFGEAKNMAATLHYVEVLEALPMLSNVYLQEHEVDLEDAMNPVTFMIVAQWI